MAIRRQREAGTTIELQKTLDSDNKELQNRAAKTLRAMGKKAKHVALPPEPPPPPQPTPISTDRQAKPHGTG
jgi:hypothetical protein